MNTEGFERVARKHKNRVYSHAVRMLRRTADAEDVTQEALVRLWQHRGKVDGETAQFWLLRTVHNLCIDRIRRRRASPEAEAELNEAISPDPRHGPARLVESVELGGQIDQALADLPERDRAVLLLREVQELPYAEIASLLEVPLGTLKARLHRAREQLRTKLVRAGVAP